MIVSDILELSVVTVLERGKPNEECIAIQANEQANLGQYGIMLGTYSTETGLFPFRDNLFWFGDGVVYKDDWIFVYTGSGEARKSTTINQLNNVYSIYWGKKTTIFANTNIVPMLFRIDAVDILAPPTNVLQLGSDNA